MQRYVSDAGKGLHFCRCVIYCRKLSKRMISVKSLSLLASLIILCLCLGGCSIETKEPDRSSISTDKPSTTTSSTTGTTTTTTSTTERSTTTTTTVTTSTTTSTTTSATSSTTASSTTITITTTTTIPTTTTTTTTTTATTTTTTTTTAAPTDNNVEALVWIPQSGAKYHSKASCSNMKNPSQVSKSEAIGLGYEPCKKCYK